MSTSVNANENEYKTIVLGDYAEYEEKVKTGEWTYDQFNEFFTKSRRNGISNTVFPFAIGGSDAGTIMGVSHFATPLELYFEKTGIRKKPAPDKASYFRFAIGHKFEDPIREFFSMVSGLEAIPCTQQFLNTRYPHCVANIDGLVWEIDENGQKWLGIYEGKTTEEFSAIHDDFKRGVVPQSYMCQVQFYMEVLDLDFAYINCAWGLNPLSKMKYIRVKRDKAFGEEICLACEEFVKNTILGRRPKNENVQSLDALQRCYQRLYGNGDLSKPPVKISSQFRSTFERYVELCEMETKVLKDMEPVKAQLKPYEEQLKEIDKQREDIKKIFPAVLQDATSGTFMLNNQEITVNYKPTGKYALDKEVKEYWQTTFPESFEKVTTFKEQPRKIEIKLAEGLL